MQRRIEQWRARESLGAYSSLAMRDRAKPAPWPRIPACTASRRARFGGGILGGLAGLLVGIGALAIPGYWPARRGSARGCVMPPARLGSSGPHRSAHRRPGRARASPKKKPSLYSGRRARWRPRQPGAQVIAVIRNGKSREISAIAPVCADCAGRRRPDRDEPILTITMARASGSDSARRKRSVGRAARWRWLIGAGGRRPVGAAPGAAMAAARPARAPDDEATKPDYLFGRFRSRRRGGCPDRRGDWPGRRPGGHSVVGGVAGGAVGGAAGEGTQDAAARLRNGRLQRWCASDRRPVSTRPTPLRRGSMSDPTGDSAVPEAAGGAGGAVAGGLIGGAARRPRRRGRRRLLAARLARRRPRRRRAGGSRRGAGSRRRRQRLAGARSAAPWRPGRRGGRARPSAGPAALRPGTRRTNAGARRHVARPTPPRTPVTTPAPLTARATPGHGDRLRYHH